MKNHRGNRHQTHPMIALFLFFVIMASFQMMQCVGATIGVASSKQRRSNVNIAFFVPSSSSPILSAPRRSTMKTITRQSSLGNMKFLQPRAMMMLHPSSSLLDSTSLIASNTIALQSAQLTEAIDSTTAAASVQIEQQDPTTTIVIFIIGIIPFIWATFEFWRRIAVGASFGTTSDSVVIPSPFDDNNNDSDNDDMITIGEDGNPMSSRGRRTLDRGALTVAYVLFAIAAGSVGLAVASVVMGPTTPL
ncbi:hypothetical protein ACHAWC_010452 [Mediolabrus comicus]